jgi:Flp pilus assembly protein TadD
MLEKALALDPHFAEARRWHGFASVLMIDSGRSNDTAWLYKAEEEFRQALQDEPGLESIHSALTALYVYQGRHDLARSEIEKGLKLKPDDPEVLMWLINYDILKGEYSEATTLVNRILEREPLFSPARWNLADILRQQGDFAGAVREMGKVLDLAPGSVNGIALAVAYLDAGDLPKARALLEQSRAVDKKNFVLRLAWAALLALEGKPADALEEMDTEVLKYAEISPLITVQAAEVYAVVGDKSKALDWLDRAVRNQDDRAEWFRRDPLLASIRQEPRFAEILEPIEHRKKQLGKQ